MAPTSCWKHAAYRDERGSASAKKKVYGLQPAKGLQDWSIQGYVCISFWWFSDWILDMVAFFDVPKHIDLNAQTTEVALVAFRARTCSPTMPRMEDVERAPYKVELIVDSAFLRVVPLPNNLVMASPISYVLLQHQVAGDTPFFDAVSSQHDFSESQLRRTESDGIEEAALQSAGRMRADTINDASPFTHRKRMRNDMTPSFSGRLGCSFAHLPPSTQLNRFTSHSLKPKMHCSTVLAALVALSASSLTQVDAYGKYIKLLPNGGDIPDNTNIGHLNAAGTAGVSVFGKAFKAAGNAWNTALCQADSDGDGFTNGQEMGDPCCTWTPTSTASLVTEGLSDPNDASKKPSNAALIAGCSASGSSKTTTSGSKETINDVLAPVSATSAPAAAGTPTDDDEDDSSESAVTTAASGAAAVSAASAVIVGAVAAFFAM
ncbi:hypothetical protein FI667_g9059, partial [Globisporangium splendens]